MIILDALHHSNTRFFISAVRACCMMTDKTVACRQLKVGHSDRASSLPFNSWNESRWKLLAFFVSSLSTRGAEGVACWQVVVSCIVVDNSRAAWFEIRAPLLCTAQWRKAFARDFASQLVTDVSVEIITSDVNWWIGIFLEEKNDDTWN